MVRTSNEASLKVERMAGRYDRLNSFTLYAADPIVLSDRSGIFDLLQYGPNSSVIFVLLGKLLEGTSYGSVRVESLSNYAFRGKRTSDLLANATNVAILCELTTNCAVLAEDRCALAGFLFACGSLNITLDLVVSMEWFTYRLVAVLVDARRHVC